MKYSHQNNKPVLIDIGICNKCRLLDAANITEQRGEDICSILTAFHCLTSCVTTNDFVCLGNTPPFTLFEKDSD